MVKKLSKSESLKEIYEFFFDIKSKTPRLSQARSDSSKSQAKEIKKIKRLAMKHNIPLKDKRKLFCKKCYSVYRKPKIRIKNKIKSVICGNCGYKNRWKVT